MDRKYEIGETVEHKLSKDWVMVIGYDEKFIICRTKQFKMVKLAEFEVRKIRR